MSAIPFRPLPGNQAPGATLLALASAGTASNPQVACNAFARESSRVGNQETRLLRASASVLRTVVRRTPSRRCDSRPLRAATSYGRS
jgi:hypothetical protein